MALSVFQVQEEAYDQEVLLFTVNEQSYGLNVLKVKEIIQPQTIYPSPNRNKIVEGIIQLRKEALPVLNTYELLQSESGETLYFIVVELGEKSFALKVDNVLHIERIHSKDIYPPDQLAQEKDAFVSGVISLDQNQIAYLFDVEKVMQSIHPIHLEQDYYDDNKKRAPFEILFIEDSPTMSAILLEALQDSGYEDITVFDNGKDAYQYLCDSQENNVYHAIITDIDLPFMSGFDFAKKVRKLSSYSEVPILSFSSLHQGVMEQKGKRIGITEHIEKPNIKKLIQTLDQHLLKQ